MSTENEKNNKNEDNKIEKDKIKEDKVFKKGFFKKIWYSVFKLEKYGEMAAEGVVRAITYLIKLSLIVALVISFGTLYKINGIVNKGVEFINNEVGDFSFKEGKLIVEKQETIIAPSSMFGKVIIDTKINTNEEINQYLNSMEFNRGILVLNDRVLTKGISSNGIVSYEYKSIVDEDSLNALNKQKVLDYLNKDSWSIYLLVFALILGYSLLNTFLPILFNVFLLSLFGYMATWFAKIKIRYPAVFNLAAYSLTLSVLLYAVYIGVNIFVDFTIKYFQIMYIGVAAIYLIAAILLIKSEFIKKQVEVSKIVQMKNDEERKKEQEKLEGE